MDVFERLDAALAEKDAENAALKQRLEKVEAALIDAAVSLWSYEQSYGGGGGESDALDIARMFGFDGGSTECFEWLCERAAVLYAPPADRISIPEARKRALAIADRADAERLAMAERESADPLGEDERAATEKYLAYAVTVGTLTPEPTAQHTEPQRATEGDCLCDDIGSDLCHEPEPQQATESGPSEVQPTKE